MISLIYLLSAYIIPIFVPRKLYFLQSFHLLIFFILNVKSLTRFNTELDLLLSLPLFSLSQKKKITFKTFKILLISHMACYVSTNYIFVWFQKKWSQQLEPENVLHFSVFIWQHGVQGKIFITFIALIFALPHWNISISN